MWTRTDQCSQTFLVSSKMDLQFGSQLKDFLVRNIDCSINPNIIITSIDRLESNPELPLFMIVNESNHDSPGTHWIGCYIDKGENVIICRNCRNNPMIIFSRRWKTWSSL